jgi:hypothetical protein
MSGTQLQEGHADPVVLFTDFESIFLGQIENLFVQLENLFVGQLEDRLALLKSGVACAMCVLYRGFTLDTANHFSNLSTVVLVVVSKVAFVMMVMIM